MVARCGQAQGAAPTRKGRIFLDNYTLRLCVVALLLEYSPVTDISKTTIAQHRFSTDLYDPTAAHRPTLGLALGGGGMRGIANIGVLKALTQAGIVPDYIAGTSMGGIIAALYATGLSIAEIEVEALHLAKRSQVVKLVDWLPGRRGLMKGQNIYNYLTRLIGDNITFDDLQLPIALTAVDLIHRDEVVLRAGRVVDAVRASMAVPGVFEPVELAGRRLVDGGVLNNVPADVARDLGADVVIAVDVGVGAAYDEVSGDETGAKSPFPFFTPAFALDLWQAQSIMVDALTEHKLRDAQTEVVLRPAIPVDVGLFTGISQIDHLIAVGVQAVQEALPQIRATCKAL